MASVENHHVYPANPLGPKPLVSYGIPFHEACAYHAQSFEATRIYIVVSTSISKTNAFQDLKSSLDPGKIIGIRYGVAQHTPWEDVFALAQDLRSTEADLIITLGGGSITDAVKLARIFVSNNVLTIEAVDDLFKNCDPVNPGPGEVNPATIPVINVPTTLSGGEFTLVAGATDTQTGHKRVMMHQSMCADFVVLDPTLSISTPARFWLSTGVRALDHFIEGIYGNVGAFRKGVSGVSQRDIEGSITSAIRSLLVSLLETKENWDGYNARLRAFLAIKDCPLAGNNGTGASHGIGHQLGPLGVGHGETSCVMLPWVLKYNWKHGDDELRGKLQLVMDVFWEDERLAEELRARCLSREDVDLGDVVGTYINALGLPRTLDEFGVGEAQFNHLAENAMQDFCTKVNPVKLDKAKVIEILQMAA
ncbi:hypothetical protein EDB80DRAFT_721245 [Ilyonectria destructans]|nr:hypothetical protein EDB80DRAFT_721245 [Ilyonectria destructans]